MSMRAFICILFVYGTCTVTRGQNREAQIDQSRLLQTPVGSGDAKPRTASDSAALSELLIEPDDALGAQRFLKSQQNVRPFAASAELFGFKTNNVGLTRRDTQPDEFLVASTTFSYRTSLGERAAVDINVRGSIFRYNEFRTLDFNSIDAGVGGRGVHARRMVGRRTSFARPALGRTRRMDGGAADWRYIRWLRSACPRLGSAARGIVRCGVEVRLEVVDLGTGWVEIRSPVSDAFGEISAVYHTGALTGKLRLRAFACAGLPNR